MKTFHCDPRLLEAFSFAAGVANYIFKQSSGWLSDFGSLPRQLNLRPCESHMTGCLSRSHLGPGAPNDQPESRWTC